MTELPPGKNTTQHAPAGELPPSFHPSQYWDPLMHKEQGMALYGRFCKPGDLVFDIGANVGERTGWFLELGCEVVAVEPLQHLLNHADGRAHRVCAAVGPRVEASVPFYHCTHSHYLSTLSQEYVRQVYEQPGIGGNVYTEITTSVVTLDWLIDWYGVPAFCKIDVEGGEAGVLAGLSESLAALSFEVHSFAPEKAAECQELIERDGYYDYFYAALETFKEEPWPPRELAIFGDVYAVRR